jgi:catechol 2,3-dioxygenase-like lactoylglutathione lyase family enzyme
MRRVHHIALRTGDIERLGAFYRDYFGLQERRDQRPRAVWLGLEEAVLMIERRADDEPDVPRGTLELVAFAGSVEERLQLRARLASEGRLEAESEHTVYFRDPDGRRVALSSYPLPDGV